jgi:hypothetical protein
VEQGVLEMLSLAPPTGKRRFRQRTRPLTVTIYKDAPAFKKILYEFFPSKEEANVFWMDHGKEFLNVCLEQQMTNHSAAS